MNMREPNTQRLLTDEELHSLLAPVPLELQQREALVRIDLRPGLPSGYAGPVELDDLRLWLSPWHWLRQELAISSHSEAISQGIAEARAAGENLETAAELTSWISNELFDDEKGYTWGSNPGDNWYWGHYDIVGDRDGHFLHPSFEFRVVQFFEDDSMSEGIVVAQAVWDWKGKAEATGPVGIFAMHEGRDYDWLYNTDELWLTDSVTGETCKLEPGGDDEWENPEDWTGQIPCLHRYKSGSTDQSRSALLAGLRYEAGNLYRADTNALLTLALTRPEMPTTT